MGGMANNRGGGQSGGNQRGPARQQGFNQNRRAGNASFNNPGGFHQGGSFKNRNQGHGNQNRQRHDGGSQPQQKENAAPSIVPATGKKEENKRTLTDFKIVGLEIPELDWSWGTLPPPPAEAVKVEVKDEPLDSAADVSVKDEVSDDKGALKVPAATDKQESQTEGASQVTEVAEGAQSQAVPATPRASRYPAEANGANQPPSRMRIYFDTPVTADDSKPIPHNASHGYSDAPSDSRKGKRKKLEDDDGDSLEDIRPPPPPPQMSAPMTDDRSSVAASIAPSTAETASEGDWLMAAIVEGDEEAQAAAALQPGAEEDGDAVDGDHERDAEGEEDLDADAEGEVEHLVGDDGEQPFCLKMAAKSVEALLAYFMGAGCLCTALTLCSLVFKGMVMTFICWARMVAPPQSPHLQSLKRLNTILSPRRLLQLLLLICFPTLHPRLSLRESLPLLKRRRLLHPRWKEPSLLPPIRLFLPMLRFPLMMALSLNRRPYTPFPCDAGFTHIHLF